ncbi:MAG: Hsp33 family molecular chaperone HslO [bacterium]|nr:Hsp33 family molecular chaperone HslO [bacterium]
MKDELIEILDPASKIAVLCVDCTTAAGQLARGHLSGPTAARYLAQALAGVALLGAETSQKEETVTFRLDCPGPLEGFLVECTAAGTLRGYTKKKILNDFDGMGTPKDVKVLGETGTFEIIRSIPGTILSSGTVATAWTKGAVAAGLDAFFDQSLQRRVRTAVAATANDDGVPLYARGLLAECAPDGDVTVFEQVSEVFASGAAAKALAVGAAAPRTLLKKLGLPHAEIRKTSPLSYACRCSAERAAAMLAAIPPDERATLPPTLDITCHMCGRTWTISTQS